MINPQPSSSSPTSVLNLKDPAAEQVKNLPQPIGLFTLVFESHPL